VATDISVEHYCPPSTLMSDRARVKLLKSNNFNIFTKPLPGIVIANTPGIGATRQGRRA